MAGLFASVQKGLRGVMGQSGTTAAIVQFEAVHEEVIPSVCRTLINNGITPTVFLNEAIRDRRGDVFEHLCKGQFDYHYVCLEGHKNWLRLKDRLLARRSDAFVFLNTFQRDGIANFAKTLAKPILGIVHNPELFLQAKDCLALAEEDRVGLVTLADHASSYFIARQPHLADRVTTLVPIYWGDDLAAPDLTAPRRRIIAPGAVNFRNRSYDFLFDTFAAAPDLANRLEIRILGGGPDRPALEARVSEAGLTEAITFSKLNAATGFVDHTDYFADLRKAAFTLPLLPHQKQEYRVYKITAGLSTAQGFCLPPILDRWTALVYRVPALHTNETPLKSAAQMSDTDYQTLQAALTTRRALLLRQNDNELAYLLRATGITAH